VIDERQFERVALTGVICAAVALALFWVFLVPIFQSPDEGTHYDYATALATAHHPLRASEGVSQGLADPDVMYLTVATETSRIAFHGEALVPPGYGTNAYYQMLDRSAPAVDRRYYDRTPHDRPWILAAYPIGYYALDAVWIDAARLFTKSVVAQFFAARTLGVAMLALSLVFIYATLRLVRFGPLFALVGTAAAGFLPLTTFVASYIQPDNYSLLAVSATLYFALRTKLDPTNDRLIFIVGILLGLTRLAKLQFALSIALPVVLMIVVARLLRPAVERRMKFVWFALLGPICITTLFHYWIVFEPTSHYLAGYHTTVNHDRLATALASGKIPAYVWSEFTQALKDFYFGGTTSLSFWGVFGWLDTPITIFNRTVEAGIRTLTNYLTGAGLIVIIALTASRLQRIARVARRRGRLSAFRLILANPLLNTYITFSLLILAIYIVLDDSFGAQGRNWLPLIVCTIYVIFHEFAQIVRGQRARTMARVVCATVMVGYSAVGSYYGAQSVLERYYAPRVANVLVPRQIIESHRNTRGSIDIMIDEADRPVSTIASDEKLVIRGWADDADARSAAGAVYVSVDGKRDFHADYGGRRDDVAAIFGDDERATSVLGSVPAGTLTPGDHLIGLHVVDRDFTTYYEIAGTRIIHVTK